MGLMHRSGEFHIIVSEDTVEDRLARRAFEGNRFLRQILWRTQLNATFLEDGTPESGGGASVASRILIGEQPVVPENMSLTSRGGLFDCGDGARDGSPAHQRPISRHRRVARRGACL